jgi:hypothetical protein
LKYTNIYEGENAKLAQWTVTNESNEEVRVNKVNLVATYGGQAPTGAVAPKNLKHAYVECVLKDEKGTVLSDTFTLENGVPEEITLKTQNNKSLLVIPEQRDDVEGEKEIILYATVAKGAQVAGTVKIALGDAATGNIMEITGAVTGETRQITGTPIEAGKGADLRKVVAGATLTNTVGISPIMVTSTSLGSAPVKGAPNATVAKFTLRNTGDKTVHLTAIGLKAAEDTSGSITPAPQITNLDIVRDNSIIATAPVPTVGGVAVSYGLTTPLEIAKGESKSFEVRLNGADTLDFGERVALELDRATTVYDNSKDEGYAISIDINDKQDETITLESKQTVNP